MATDKFNEPTKTVWNAAIRSDDSVRVCVYVSDRCAHVIEILLVFLCESMITVICLSHNLCVLNKIQIQQQQSHEEKRQNTLTLRTCVHT